MKRVALLACAVGLGSIIGCPGSLDNPEAFGDGGTIVRDADTIFGETCATAGCHDETTMIAGLLLEPPVEDAVVGVNSTGEGCETRVLVVPGDPNASYLFELVLDNGLCHSRMPFLRDPLPDGEIEVLRNWIIDLEPDTGALDGG